MLEVANNCGNCVRLRYTKRRRTNSAVLILHFVLGQCATGGLKRELWLAGRPTYSVRLGSNLTFLVAFRHACIANDNTDGREAVKELQNKNSLEAAHNGLILKNGNLEARDLFENSLAFLTVGLLAA